MAFVFIENVQKSHISLFLKMLTMVTPPDTLPLVRSLDTTKVSFLFSLVRKAC